MRDLVPIRQTTDLYGYVRFVRCHDPDRARVKRKGSYFLSSPRHRVVVVVLCNNIMRKLLALATLATGVAVTTPVHAASRCGLSSHYGVGDGYAWQTMANGRPMNPGANITAHRTLPLGSRIRVTNPGNGRSVVVTVTDRGPYHGGRILDLSHGAFSRIASPSSGVASVCYTRLS